MATTTLADRLAKASTYHPTYISIQTRAIGDALDVALASDRYATMLTHTHNRFAADGPSWSSAMGSASLLLLDRTVRPLTRHMSYGQANRFCDFIAHVLYFDASGGAVWTGGCQ